MVSLYLLICLQLFFLFNFLPLISLIWFDPIIIYHLGVFYFLMCLFSAVWHECNTADTSYTYIHYIFFIYSNSAGVWEDSTDHVTMFSPSPLQSRLWHFPCTLTAPQWADNASRHPSIHCKPKCTYSNCHPCKCMLVAISELCWDVNSSVFQHLFCICFFYCFFSPDGLLFTLLASCDIWD